MKDTFNKISEDVSKIFFHTAVLKMNFFTGCKDED